MKIWWCEVHRSTGTEHVCDGMELIKASNVHYTNDCRIVEMQLVPADARVVSDLTDEELLETMWGRVANKKVKRIRRAFDSIPDPTRTP